MIIFNADDYALTKIDVLRINDSISKKIIRSTTAVANGAENCFPSALSALSTGIHINLVEGRSLTAPSSLSDEDGFFLSKSEVFKRLALGRVSMKELENEIAAQFKMLIDFGVFISHIDTHQNLHIAPPILGALIRVGEDFGIRKIRGQCSEYGWFGHFNPIKSRAKNIFSIYWHSLLPKNWVASERIILNAPGLGQNVSTIFEAIRMWEVALSEFYIPHICYEIPCHLHLSDFEFDLYNSPGFLEMTERLKVKVGNYYDL